MSRFTCTLLTTIFVVAATSHANVTASVIVQDTFTGSGTANNGRTPFPTDAPGGNWLANGGGELGSGGHANTLELDGNGSSWLSIASAGSYTKPGIFQISADLNLAGTVGANGGSYGDGYSAYGINLGFSPDPTSDYRPGVGIVYTSNNTNSSLGELLLFNGTTLVQDLGPTGFSSTGTYNLSYVVNTATKSISDVTFNGNAIAVGATTLFSDTATTWAGLYQRPNGSDTTAAFADNFTITAVPEPVSLVLLGLGAVGLIPVALRRRRV